MAEHTTINPAVKRVELAVTPAVKAVSAPSDDSTVTSSRRPRRGTRMHIGIATHNYPPHLGGLEAIVHHLARGFAREHDVTVVTTAWDGRSGVTDEDGVTVHRLPAWHGTEDRGVPYATPVGPGIFAACAAL